MFQLVACNLAVLAIAMIYYAWRDGYLRATAAQAGLQRAGRVHAVGGGPQVRLTVPPAPPNHNGPAGRDYPVGPRAFPRRSIRAPAG